MPAGSPAALFAQEAYLSLALALVLLLHRARGAPRCAARPASGSVFSAELLLVLGALFCTVAGYFARAADDGGGAGRAGRLCRSARCTPSRAGFFALKAPAGAGAGLAR